MKNTTTIDDGGPAFPFDPEACGVTTRGMSLRDWFAGQVAAGFMSNVGWTTARTTQQECLNPEHNPGAQLAMCVAVESYMVADAMIVARKAVRP